MDEFEGTSAAACPVAKVTWTLIRLDELWGRLSIQHKRMRFTKEEMNVDPDVRRPCMLHIYFMLPARLWSYEHHVAVKRKDVCNICHGPIASYSCRISRRGQEVVHNSKIRNLGICNRSPTSNSS